MLDPNHAGPLSTPRAITCPCTIASLAIIKLFFGAWPGPQWNHISKLISLRSHSSGQIASDTASKYGWKILSKWWTGVFVCWFLSSDPRNPHPANTPNLISSWWCWKMFCDFNQLHPPKKSFPKHKPGGSMGWVGIRIPFLQGTRLLTLVNMPKLEEKNIYPVTTSMKPLQYIYMRENVLI